MTYFQAILLGIIQGLTEFLPVSSSGHLVLSQELLGVGGDAADVSFELLVHLGTLAAVVIYFRGRLIDLTKSLFQKARSMERRMIFFLFLGTLPAVAAYLCFKDAFEAAYSSPRITAVLLCFTGLLLLIPRFVKRQSEGSEEVGLKQAILMGLGQAVAILPGISRSGSTIVAGMLSGVKPAAAAEFSFLLAIPAILGGGVTQMDELASLDPALLGPYLAGALAAFISGLAAVYGVLASIRKGKFEYFAYYCLFAGVAAFIYFSIRA